MNAMDEKVFGLDTEQSKDFQEKDSTRMVQVYDPEKKVAYCYYRSSSDAPYFQVHKVDIAMVEESIKSGTDVPEDAVVNVGINCPTEKLVEFLRNPNNSFVPHNGLYDWAVLYRDFKVLPKIAGDSYILASLIPSGNASRSLDAVCKKWVSESYNKSRWGSWEDFDFTLPSPTKEQLLYGAYDAYGSYQAERSMRHTNAKYVNRAYLTELELTTFLAKTRLIKYSVKKDAVEAAINNLREEYQQILDSVTMQTGEVFHNVNKEIKKILFEVRGNKPVIMSDKGVPSLSIEALRSLTDPIVISFLRLKEISSNLKSLAELGANMNSNDTEFFSFIEPKQISAYDLAIVTGKPPLSLFDQLSIPVEIGSPTHQYGKLSLTTPYLKFRCLVKALTGEWLSNDFIETKFAKYLDPSSNSRCSKVAFQKCIEMVVEGYSVAFLIREFGDLEKATKIHEDFWAEFSDLALAIEKEIKNSYLPVRQLQGGYFFQVPYVRGKKDTREAANAISARIAKIASAAAAKYQKDILMALHEKKLPLTLFKTTSNSLGFIVVGEMRLEDLDSIKKELDFTPIDYHLVSTRG